MGKKYIMRAQEDDRRFVVLLQLAGFAYAIAMNTFVFEKVSDELNRRLADAMVRIEYFDLEKKEKLDAAAILRMIPEIVNCAKKPLEMALGDLCLHHLQLYAAVARQDSAQAALDTQKLVSAVYTALAAAQNWIRVRHADIRLRPDFSGGEESSWAVRLRLSFHPIVMLAAALRFAFCLLRLLLAQKKKEQPV